MSKNFNLVLFFLFFISLSYSLADHPDCVLLAQEAAGSNSNVMFTEVFKGFAKLKAGDESAVVSEEITFKRDVGNFKLLSGNIYFCEPFEERTYALIFIGKGEFSFTPPTKVEQDQLYRFYETNKFRKEFHTLFILFGDSTYRELNNKLNFQKVKNVDGNIDSKIEDCIEYLIDLDHQSSRSDLLRTLLSGEDNGLFYAQIYGDDINPVFFLVNPFLDEEVSFMKRNRSTLISNYIEVINQFPVGNNFKKSKDSNKYFLYIISYKIESTIEDNLDFSAVCTIDFTSNEKKQNWTTFELFYELEVDSIIWEDGRSAKFARLPDTYNLWLYVKDKYLDSKQHWFSIYYHGDLLEKDQLGWISLRSSIYWYPRLDYRTEANFGLIFHTPSDYNFVSVGNLIQKHEKDDVITTTWLSDVPIRNASFSLGNFEITNLTEEDLPIVNVYMSEYGHNQIGSQLAQYGILSISDASEHIAADVVNSLSLFQTLFGKINSTTISVTEIPYMHGEAFPGLVHLSWSTFQYMTFEGEDEIFRAHEVAHQWWGISVDFKTYHDQWLSEGFSQYCGLWYLLVVKEDSEMFFDMLEKWRDEIINNRQYLFGSGQEAGPIWLGYRTNSTATRGDYDLIIYKKGAFVLHMLRGMLLNLKTMNEDRFENMMKDYFKTYFGKSASTEDFLKMVSKHFGEDMSWFFDQYVYGTDIPLYEFGYKTEVTKDGNYLVTCRVEQKNVDEKFKMYVPLKIVLSSDRIARVRVEISGKEKIFQLPLLPAEPDEIIFNDLESVLCEVDYVDWD